MFNSVVELARGVHDESVVRLEAEGVAIASEDGTFMCKLNPDHVERFLIQFRGFPNPDNFHSKKSFYGDFHLIS